MSMIEKNIFRALPSLKVQEDEMSAMADAGGIEQGQFGDPAWPFLHGVYDILLQIVVNENIEVRVLKSYISPQFVQSFLQLFDSE